MNSRVLYSTVLVAALVLGSIASMQSAAASSDAKVFEITGNDAMQFNVTEMTVAPGQKVSLAFKNIGKLPAQAMSHNWVLLSISNWDDVPSLAMDAATKAPVYLPADQSKIIAHTKMLGPGESDTIEFTAPTTPGEYWYICTFPGHFALMKGKLIVK
jgi:azurin